MNSEVNASTNPFTSTETLVTASNTLYQAPMSSALTASGRRKWHKKLMASTRISMMTLMSANNGPRGKAATNMVMKPYCKTKGQKKVKTIDILQFESVVFSVSKGSVETNGGLVPTCTL